jgi:glutamate---cysteine ligase / carboxylate-amine ligase
MSALTIGVEEEFHLVDAATRRSTAGADAVLGRTGDEVVAELKASVVETNSDTCTTLDELTESLRERRRELIEAAAAHGLRPLAAGSAPLVDPDALEPSDGERYQQMSARYGPVAQAQVVAGLQTHVGIDDRELAVQVMNRATRFAPVLLALSASSPYWFGRDSGWASARTRVWGRWPSAGIPGRFADVGEYDRLVEDMVATGTILDPGMVYFDVRLSQHNPTVEFRSCDSTARLAEAVTLAGLWRALAATCLADVESSGGPPPARTELLRAAAHQAASAGLAGRLLHPLSLRPVPAADAVDALLAAVGPALDDAGDGERVRSGVADLLRAGGSATEQRRRFEATGGLEPVVDELLDLTAAVD